VKSRVVEVGVEDPIARLPVMERKLVLWMEPRALASPDARMRVFDKDETKKEHISRRPCRVIERVSITIADTGLIAYG